MMVNGKKKEKIQALFGSRREFPSDLNHETLDDDYDEIELFGFPVSVSCSTCSRHHSG